MDRHTHVKSKHGMAELKLAKDPVVGAILWYAASVLFSETRAAWGQPKTAVF